ncbi:MAG: type II toxin-antitoxin system RelE/ParE family toxin [Terracidiphilus sp.]|nr:type II toxin-antitoxin system RelE/ParE family toxin [Terracidiphilus sp.]MDR3798648.1 type II toxin-antitoxin system RelE/ParE family toxin [Terracidiphilus sp.]
MERKVRFTKAARQDLEEIYYWIAGHDAPAKAEYVLDRLSAAAQRMAALPGAGSRPRELPTGVKGDYRQVFFKPYRVIYRVTPAEIVIHLIADGRRNLNALLLQRLTSDQAE